MGSLMGNSSIPIDVVHAAQRGDKAARTRLAEQAREMLTAYVARITMKEERVNEIVQDSLYDMVRNLNQLKHADRFSHWLRKIATNRLRRHYRDQWQRRAVSLDGLDRDIPGKHPDAVDVAGQEIWYYYPPHSPDCVQLQVKGPPGTEITYCQWWQNNHGNYYRQDGAITIKNAHWYHPDGAVMRLPTDSPVLTEFLDRIEGRQSVLEYVPWHAQGMLVVSRWEDSQRSQQVSLRRDVSDEEYFRYHWPADAKVVDQRDPMHRRGWTYFKVSGHLGDRAVSGEGCLPFVATAYADYTPWIQLRIEGGAEFVDNGRTACYRDKHGRIVQRYPGASFFRGLSRPWQGLHSVDTIRRDAALFELPFENSVDSGRMHISISQDDVSIRFVVDMKADVLESIIFLRSQKQWGHIKYRYLQDESALDLFRHVKPKLNSQAKTRSSEPGSLWLIQLATDSF